MSNVSKQCSRCGQIKRLDEFYRRALSADGRSASCSACQKRYREENREKVRESSRRYREENREKVREASRRYRDRKRGAPPRPRLSQVSAQESRRRYRERNPEKVRESRKRWRDQNRDKLRESGRRYREENANKLRESQRRWLEANPGVKRMYTQRRKARKRDAITFMVAAKDLRRLRSGRCIACGGAAGTIDHLIPLSRGGSHGVGNLAAMCVSCNSRKSVRTIAEWRKVNDWLPLGRFSKLRKDS